MGVEKLNTIISTRISEGPAAEYKAKEVFEDIGFVLEDQGDILIYTKAHAKYDHVITFDNKKTTVKAEEIRDGISSPYPLRSAVFKAVLKQCKELNWL